MAGLAFHADPAHIPNDFLATSITGKFQANSKVLGSSKKSKPKIPSQSLRQAACFGQRGTDSRQNSYQTISGKGWSKNGTAIDSLQADSSTLSYNPRRSREVLDRNSSDRLVPGRKSLPGTSSKVQRKSTANISYIFSC